MNRVNCGNYFTEDRFEKFCEVLEKEKTACVYIDCTGHTQNNYGQETYKKHLEEKYGDRLILECVEGLCSYHYQYTLKEVN